MIRVDMAPRWSRHHQVLEGTHRSKNPVMMVGTGGSLPTSMPTVFPDQQGRPHRLPVMPRAITIETGAGTSNWD